MVLLDIASWQRGGLPEQERRWQANDRGRATGRSVGEIAEQLVLSPNTVSTCRIRILETTWVRNDVELALYAVRMDALPS